MENQVEHLQAVINEQAKEIAKLKAAGKNREKLSVLLVPYKGYNDSLVVACEKAIDEYGNLDYDTLDRYDPALLQRIKTESPGLYQTLVSNYISENSWLLTGHKPEIKDEPVE